MFQAALINEIEKLYKKKKIMVAIFISLAVIVIGQLIIVGMRTGFGLRGVGSIEFPILILSVAVNTILPLLVALVAIDCFSSEFSNNMMRVTLTRPASRLKVYTAKVTTIAIFILFNISFLLTFSLLAGFLFNVNSATLAGLFNTVLSYGVSIVPMMVLALGIVLLANIFKNGTSVFFVSALGFIILKAAGIFFSQHSSLFITSQLDWYNLWLASSFPLVKIIHQLLIMLGYAIMFFTAGYYLFDKKEY